MIFGLWLFIVMVKEIQHYIEKSADKNEINGFFHDPDHYCKIWREFQTSTFPDYWVVWPHSESKGWCERLTGEIKY